MSWKSKKQGCVAHSSAEAEYMALAAAVKEAIWFGNIFKFIMSTPDGTAVPILVDNQGAIKMAKNDSSSTRTKHIDIQYHFVRDSQSKKLFKIDYCPTNDMTADLLTKPLQRLLIRRFKQDLGLTKI